MAFKRMPTAEEKAEAFEREVAGATPYSVSSEQEARALFRQIHKDGGWRERDARTEASRRHLDANPGDVQVAAGLFIGWTSVLDAADLAVREAMELLEPSAASVGCTPR